MGGVRRKLTGKHRDGGHRRNAQRKLPDAWIILAPLLAFFVGAMLSRRLSGCRQADHRLLVERRCSGRADFLPLDREVAVMIVEVARGVARPSINTSAAAKVRRSS